MTTPAMRTRLTLSCGLLLALGAAGCATSRLASLAPEGVNLSGEWVLNTNLSDDQESLDALDKVNAKKKKKQKAPASGEGSGDAATDLATASATSPVPQHLFEGFTKMSRKDFDTIFAKVSFREWGDHIGSPDHPYWGIAGFPNADCELKVYYDHSFETNRAENPEARVHIYWREIKTGYDNNDSPFTPENVRKLLNR